MLEGHVPDAPVVFVRPPRMRTADDPCPEELGPFSERIACAIGEAAHLAPFEGDMHSLTWEGLTARFISFVHPFCGGDLHDLFRQRRHYIFMKPPGVVDAVVRGISSFGGVGRGVHPASLEAGRAVFEARRSVARLLGAPSPSCVSFSLNATMALNIALQGLAAPGCTLVTTAASHNSVLRPLNRLRDESECVVKVASIKPDGSLDFDEYERMLSEGGVRYVAATHASNLTGDVYDVARMAQIAHKHGALFILDTAQTAGALPLSQEELGADVVCFTGHKSLCLARRAREVLCAVPDLDIAPLMEGGREPIRSMSAIRGSCRKRLRQVQ